MKSWFWIVLAVWAFLITFLVLTIADFGLDETFRGAFDGKKPLLELVVKGAILLLPVILYPIGRKSTKPSDH